MPLSCEEKAHFSLWLHHWANCLLCFKTLSHGSKCMGTTEATRNPQKLLCTVLLAPVEDKARMYCLWASEKWTICHLLSQKIIQIYFPEVGVLQQSRENKNALWHSRVMKFLVTKMQPPVYKYFYSKDLLFNIQGNNLSIKIIWPRENSKL